MTGGAGGFSRLMLRRIRALRRYLARQPGHIGLVRHDRVTGAGLAQMRNAGTAFAAVSTTNWLW